MLLTPHDILTGHFSLQDESSSLSVTIDDAVSSTKLLYTAIAAIWKKACLLITEKNSVVPAPGYGPQDKMVKSKSGSLPHLVKVSKCRLGVQYQCDQNCPQFQSAHICSHSVAAAESNKELPHFLQYFSSTFQKSSLNLMELASSGMPAGAGRKGGRAPRKRGKPKLAPVDENRTPLNTNCSFNVHSSHGHVINVGSSGDSVVNAVSPSVWQLWTWPSSASTPVLGHTQLQYGPNNVGNPVSFAPLEPFSVCLRFGNVSVCHGCRNRFSAADSIVVRHSKFRQFTSPHTGLPAVKYGNVYYHARKKCLELRWGGSLTNVTISDELKMKLTPAQASILREEFAIV